MTHIAIIQGHPDSLGDHFGHALARAYKEGAESAGHHVDSIHVAGLDFPLLKTKEDFEHGDPPESIRKSQEAIARAQHLLILYPLWLGDMPAILKGFFEQVFRPAFVAGKLKTGTVKHRTARIVITMGMPAAAYRWFYGAHSLKNLKRNILAFCGIAPVRHSLIGMIESNSSAKHQRWLDKMRSLGSQGL